MVWVLIGISITFVLLYLIYLKGKKDHIADQTDSGIPNIGNPSDYKLHIFDVYSNENIEIATTQLESINYNLQYAWVKITIDGIRKAYTTTISEEVMKDGFYIQKDGGKMVILNGEIVLWSNVI